MRMPIIGAVAVALTAAAAGYWFGYARPALVHDQAADSGKGRILYYRNPMGEADTSPVPKKDSMGMDYIPVYEKPAAAGTVTLDPAKIQRTGIRTEAAARRAMNREITAVGAIKFDETRTAVASPRVEGWIEKIHVGAPGLPVKAGQALAEIYSPELLQTQQEYFLAREAQAGAGDASGISAIANGALLRLKTLGLSDRQIRRIAAGREPSRVVTLYAPMAGVVSEKRAVEGQLFAAGDILYRIADTSNVWLVAKVFERDAANITLGSQAKIAVKALSDRTFEGTVNFIAPGVDPDSRTVDVRFEIANPDGALKADMYATAHFAIPQGQDQVTIPDSAVIDSGTRQVVLLAKGDGQFEPRRITVGPRANGYVVVLDGIAEGELVVTNAAFLVDSESNLAAALHGFAPPKPGQELPR